MSRSSMGVSSSNNYCSFFFSLIPSFLSDTRSPFILYQRKHDQPSRERVGERARQPSLRPSRERVRRWAGECTRQWAAEHERHPSTDAQTSARGGGWRVRQRQRAHASAGERARTPRRAHAAAERGRHGRGERGQRVRAHRPAMADGICTWAGEASWPARASTAGAAARPARWCGR